MMENHRRLCTGCWHHKVWADKGLLEQRVALLEFRVMKLVSITKKWNSTSDW